MVTSLLFNLENIYKVVMYHTICVNYEAKMEAGAGAKVTAPASIKYPGFG